MRTKCQFIWKFYKITLWSSWQFHLNYNNSSIASAAHKTKRKAKQRARDGEGANRCWFASVLSLRCICTVLLFELFIAITTENLMFLLVFTLVVFLFDSKLLRMQAECSLFCLLRLNKRFLAQRTNKRKKTHPILWCLSHEKFYENFKLVN